MSNKMLRLFIITTVVCLASPFVIKSPSLATISPSIRKGDSQPTSLLVNSQIFMSHGSNKELENETKCCLYKTPSGWKQRIQLNELKVGQRLLGERIPGTDLLDGKTGPKLFFECGIGRIDAKGRWQMVSAMLRFQTKYKKKSVIQKKVNKLFENQVELYVHKIRLDNGMLEVCADHESSLSATANDKKKSSVPASSLQIGKELTGTVVEVRPYGCIVDVGANRNGLLHIQTVADLFGTYIDKEKGLEKAGLERGAVIRVTVTKNERKKLALGFTEDLKEDQETGISSEVSTNQERDENEVRTEEQPEDELGGWGVYTADDYADYYDDNYDNNYDEEDDDEDKAIEDALGLGSY